MRPADRGQSGSPLPGFHSRNSWASLPPPSNFLTCSASTSLYVVTTMTAWRRGQEPLVLDSSGLA